MNILFLTLIDINDLNTRGIYTDLIRYFIEKKHKVVIISPIEKRKSKSSMTIDFDNYKILKPVIGNVQKTNKIEKGFSTLTLENKILKFIKNNLIDYKFDLLLYSTPPITFLKPILYLKKKMNVTTYLLLKDIFPQNAVDLGLISKKGMSKPIYNYFRRKEIMLYKASDYIGCMSQANSNYIKANNTFLNHDIIEVCPNSIQPINLEELSWNSKLIRQKYGLPIDKLIYLYGGNLGKPQGIEFIKKCLLLNEKKSETYIVIIGSGTEYSVLETFIKQHEIRNSKLISHLSKNDFDRVVYSSDVGLVFLDYRFTIPNFPSRLLTYMEFKLPILASTDESTDIKELVSANQIGLWNGSNDLELFSNNMEALKSIRMRQEFGKNSRNYLIHNFTSAHTYNIIMKHFSRSID